MKSITLGQILASLTRLWTTEDKMRVNMQTFERDRRGIAEIECAGGEAVGTVGGIWGESGTVESGEEERSGL